MKNESVAASARDESHALWHGTVENFCVLVDRLAIANQLTAAYIERFHVSPEPSLYRSWDNSLSFLAHVLKKAKVPHCEIALEFLLSGISLRPDVLLFGKSKNQSAGKGIKAKSWTVVVIELKQWSNFDYVSNEEDDDEEFVRVGYKGRKYFYENPYQQLGFYSAYLRSLICNSKVQVKNAYLDVFFKSYLFLHNMARTSIPNSFHQTSHKEIKTFFKEDADALAQQLSEDLGGGPEKEIYRRLCSYDFPPTNGLLTDVLANNSETENSQDFQRLDHYFLTSDQSRIFNCICRAVSSSKGDKHVCYIVRGGPGTGKSLVALKLFAEAKLKGIRAAYVIGSKILHANLCRICPNEHEDILYTNGFVKRVLKEGPYRLAIVDEAHRIRINASENQAEQIVKNSLVTVFFIDENQCISRNGVSSIGSLEEMLKGSATSIRHPKKLPGQFRCCGDTCYIEWIKGALGYDESDPFQRKPGSLFDFEIVDRPEDVLKVIENKPYVKNGYADYRLLCGNAEQGTTLKFKEFPDFSLPIYRNSIPEGKAIWGTSLATSKDLESVGNSYSSQGLDFGYVGVFFGNDYVYRKGKWESDEAEEKTEGNQSGAFISAKNAYWVLLTRGIFGCVVYFADPETKEYFLSLGATHVAQQ